MFPYNPKFYLALCPCIPFVAELFPLPLFNPLLWCLIPMKKLKALKRKGSTMAVDISQELERFSTSANDN